MNDFERGFSASIGWLQHAGGHVVTFLGFILPFICGVLAVSVIAVLGFVIFDSQNWDDEL